MDATLDDWFILSALVTAGFAAAPLGTRGSTDRDRFCSERTSLDVESGGNQQNSSRNHYRARAQHGFVGARTEGGGQKAQSNEGNKCADCHQPVTEFRCHAGES